MTAKIKDIYIGDTLRLNGKLYNVKSITKSPWIMDKRIEDYIFSLEYIYDDFGETLADLANGEDVKQ